MYAVAIAADIFGLIPGLNIITNVIAAFALGIIGLETGVNLYSPERILATGAVIVIETIPVVSIVPAWTIRVYFAKRHARLQKQRASVRILRAAHSRRLPAQHTQTGGTSRHFGASH